MVSRNPLSGGRVEVTFRMPALEGVTALSVSGDFNGWSTTATPLSRQADGSWTATLVLEGGRSYRYRYRDGEGRWHNDWQADAYVPNDFGSDDSVLIVAAPEPGTAPRAEASSRKPAAKKPAAGKQAPKKPAAKKPAVRGARRGRA